MYPYTLEGLFKAIDDVSLQDAKDIIVRGINLNLLHNRQHVFNFVLNSKIPTKDKFEILVLLVQEGAIPVLTHEQNILAQVAELFGEVGMQSQFILAAIQNHPHFHDFYSASHVQAVRGIKPDDNSFNKKDRFDLLPAYYGLISRRATDDWFNDKYDYEEKVKKGHYRGINLAWMLMYYRRFNVIAELLQALTRAQRFDLAGVAPDQDDNFDFNCSFLHLVILRQNFHIFNLLIQGFELVGPNTCLKLFAAEIANPANPLAGANALLLLVRAGKLNQIGNLINNFFSRAKSSVAFGALNSTVTNPADVNCGVHLAYEFLLRKQFKALEVLCDGLEDQVKAEDLCALFLVEPKNPDHPNFITNFAKLLLECGQSDLFNRLAAEFWCLPLARRAQLAASIHLNKVFDSDRTLFNGLTKGFENLSVEDRYNIFGDMVAELVASESASDLEKLKDFESLDAGRRFEMLMSMCNDRDFSNVAGLMLQQKLDEMFNAWTHGLSAEQNCRLLLTVPKHTFGSILAHSLIGMDESLLLQKLLANLSCDQLIEVLSGCCVMRSSDDYSTEQMTFAGVLMKTDRVVFLNMLRKFSYEELFKLWRKIPIAYLEFSFINVFIIDKIILEITKKFDAFDLNENNLLELIKKITDHYEACLERHRGSVNRKLSDLILLIIEKGYKVKFERALAKINFLVYYQINSYAPNFALEGLAHYLKHLLDDDNVVNLSICHAQMLQERARLQREVDVRRTTLDVVMVDRPSQLQAPTSPKSPNRFGLAVTPLSPNSPARTKEPARSENASGKDRVRKNLFPEDKENAVEEVSKSHERGEMPPPSPRKRASSRNIEGNESKPTNNAVSETVPIRVRKFTIADLFAAVDKQSLSEISTIIQARHFDLNELHQGEHIITHILKANPTLSDAKVLLRELIDFRVMLKPDECNNLLIRLADFFKEDKIFLEKIVKMIESDPDWLRFYSVQHIQALRGNCPESHEAELKTDHFGLLPIHYAFVSGSYTIRWFWDAAPYDFIQVIPNGFLQGVNLLWFLAQQENLTPFLDKIANLSPQKRYVIARAEPQHPSHPFRCFSVAGILALVDFESFKKLTANFVEVLPVEARYGLLTKRMMNVFGARFDSSLAYGFLQIDQSEENVDYFISLCKGFENLSLKKRYEFLSQRSLLVNVDNQRFSPSVAWYFLRQSRVDFVRSMAADFHQLDADSRFHYLTAECWLSVAGQYVKNKWFEEFFALLRGFGEFLDGDQYTQIFTSSTIHENGNLVIIIDELFVACNADRSQKLLTELKAILWSYSSFEKIEKLFNSINANTHALIAPYYFERLISEFKLRLSAKNLSRDEIVNYLERVINYSVQALENMQNMLEHFGELFSDICRTQYKTIVREFFVGSQKQICMLDGQSIFKAVETQVPGYGLEGMAMHCRLIAFGANSNLNDAVSYAKLCRDNDKLRAVLAMPSVPSIITLGDHPVPPIESRSPKKARGLPAEQLTVVTPKFRM